MERYSLMIVTDETAPIRRYDIRKRSVKRALQLAAVVAAMFVTGLVDYVRVRIDHIELAKLRVETAAQRDQITSFETTLSQVEERLAKLRDFERKLRIIANLPGSAATGGSEIIEVDATVGGDLAAEQVGSDRAGPPATDAPPTAATPAAAAAGEGEAPPASPVAARVSVLRRDAERLGIVADARSLSLADLLDRLEGKHRHLASSPSIWPTKGWLTSRFGPRVSPFTGGRQFHAGIDIAGQRGTPVVAPAAGRVAFSGSRGPLGRSLIIDHGYGVRTLYGHSDELFVKRGEQVERGQKIGSLGSTGRSTGPHLHYVVEVGGKARNPLDYIFD
jgi:murein DD-endopeptidase MepM/ murein hydrolase activator NlpD